MLSPDELFTRCPTCRTVFRTNEGQLSMQSGKVRCGQCRMVFDGRAQLVDLSPSAGAGSDDDAVGPPTVTLRDSIALQTVPAPVAADAPESEPRPENDPSGSAPDVETRRAPADNTAIDMSAERPDVAPAARAGPTDSSPEEPAVDVPTAVAQATTAADGAAGVVPYDWQEKPPMPPAMRWTLGALSFVLLLALAGQAAFLFRNALAANYPEWRPALVDVCARVGCRIEPVRGRDEITIESHDLQADPSHQGLLILQLTLRNRSSHAVAFPHLELEVLDLGGQPQVRRDFAPVEYAGGAADFTRGMPAGAEWNVKLFLDASSINAYGYNLDLFYP
jgi:predicted Zn finger-like uncharacterized protein